MLLENKGIEIGGFPEVGRNETRRTTEKLDEKL